jgi:hypothetical protein
MKEVGAMTKKMIPVLAVWAAALGSAGALAYTLDRPPRLAGAIGAIYGEASTAEIVRDRPLAPPDYQTAPAPSVVVEKAMHVRPRHTAATVHPHELSEMRCTSWGNMIQGSAFQQVRRCD